MLRDVTLFALLTRARLRALHRYLPTGYPSGVDTSASQAADRREFTRVTVPMRVRLVDETGRVHEGISRNVSLGGIRVESAARLPEGSPCAVTILLGDAEDAVEIAEHGNVVLSDGAFIAVAFDEIGLESLKHLRNLILYNSADAVAEVEAEFSSHLGIKRRGDA